jgi:hypothetical protein
MLIYPADFSVLSLPKAVKLCQKPVSTVKLAIAVFGRGQRANGMAGREVFGPPENRPYFLASGWNPAI